MVTKTDIVKYTLLPGILPRLSDFFTSGFAYIAYYMAVIYEAVGLLPRYHPFVNIDNFGRFGVRHVIVVAAGNIEFSWKKIDQLVVFILLSVGLLMIFLQFLLLILSAITIQPALAAAFPTASQMWGTPMHGFGTDQDMAFILLDMIFGVPGFFDSCIFAADACTNTNGDVVGYAGANTTPWAFHGALHSMFEFYSYGIFTIGVFVIIYFITTIAAESAQSGVPFGQRLNKTWAPVRLILFLGLLAPLTFGQVSGINAAQLILLKVAQVGSNFATNGWVYFNQQFGANPPPNTTPPNALATAQYHYLTQNSNMIAEPNLSTLAVQELVHFMAVAHTCRSVYHFSTDELRRNDFRIDAFVVRPNSARNIGGVNNAINGTAPHLDALPLANTSYDDAATFSAHGDITIRFGLIAPVENGDIVRGYRGYKGYVVPYCGEITLNSLNGRTPGTLVIKEEYYNIIEDIWRDANMRLDSHCAIVKAAGATIPIFVVQQDCANDFNQTFFNNQVEFYANEFRTAIRNGIDAQRTNGLFNVEPEIMERGWAGAALWYNKIAEMNGSVMSASNNIPESSKLPLLMETALFAQTMAKSNIRSDKLFSLEKAGELGVGIKTLFPTPNDEIRLMVMDTVHQRVSKHYSQNSHARPTNNVFLDFVNMLLGTDGVFEFRRNADVHPLAQLSALGKGMMDSVIRNMVIGLGIQLGGPLAKAFTGETGKKVAAHIGGFFMALVYTTMGMSIILYYILPLMPFMYFLFALSGWVKSIFEAMVAMPLWALAHLKIDGEGMMGPMALNGYGLLLEIFLRPILILSGLLASLATFSSLVGVLNMIFDLVVSNAGGHDMELNHQMQTSGNPGSMLSVAAGQVDMFFYTALYTIVCYMMALASFKLINTIPDKILRWAGLSTQTFQESTKDPVGQLSAQANRANILLTNQLKNRASGLAELG